MNSISTISVPKWFVFHSSLTNEIELHIYCEASQIEYGAVAYLRCFEENANQYSVSFVLSKSRLTPMKDRTLTIPKLELQAAGLATRLKVSVFEQLKFRANKTYFWTDSQITLKYIKNEIKRFQIFVMKRLHEIRANSDTTEWNYVPGEMNPAYHCTRYTPFSQLMSQTSWIDGPKCLKDNSSFNSRESLTVDEENVSTVIEEHQVHIVTNNTEKAHSCIKWKYYSSFPKLVGHISSIMKLKEKWINLKRKYAQKIDINLLTVADLKKAEREIYKHSQLESFPTEYRHLTNNQEVKKNSPLLSLRPFNSNGLTRVERRMAKSHLPFKHKHQIVVAKDHRLSKLLNTITMK